MSSLKDLARECGVSVATVSKALNGQHDISDATRARVREAAERLGYVPNMAARSMKTNRTYNLGVLFVDERQSGLSHEYFSAVLDSFKVRVERLGYDITFINSNKKHKKSKTYLEHCRYRGLDGVMIACIDFYNPEVRELVESDIPVVTIDFEFPQCLSVISDNAVGMRQLVEYIISMGHKKIAYITGDSTSVVTDIRIKGLKDTMEEHGIEMPEEWILPSEYRNLKKAAEYTRELLKREDKPTCIIYSDDYSAVGGIAAIESMGLKIPEDISVAGYDDIFIASQLQPRLTTVRQDTERIGMKAAEQLIKLIEGHKTKLSPPSVVASKLVPGASVRKLPDQ